MTKVLIVYGSRHGGTAGIAERIGEVLRAAGLASELAAADDVDDVVGADAFVIGSGVYMGSWLKEPLAFIEGHTDVLAARPVWLFSSGPVRDSTASTSGQDLLTDALGPESGPGSGGRKKIAELSAAIHPRDHRVFLGAFDPQAPPRAMSERLVRMMPAAKRVLTAGDFRQWDVIEVWAREIAAALEPSTVPA